MVFGGTEGQFVVGDHDAALTRCLPANTGEQKDQQHQWHKTIGRKFNARPFIGADAPV
jgi:hypothetical protein